MAPIDPAPIGLLPAAGRGLRFGETGYAKELFPLLWHSGEELRPRPICELSLRALRRAGARRCVVVLSPSKGEVLQVLGASAGALALAYVVQPELRGLPHAIRCAAPWLEGRDVLLALPDTIILPEDALARVHGRRGGGADVVLGVFPVEEPERLGPVELSADGGVLRVLDKPPRGTPTPRNSWALASWSPRFTAFCADWDAAAEARGVGERVLGHVFEAARQAGLRIEAEVFPGGTFLDIGTPRGLSAALRVLSEEGLLVPEQALFGAAAEVGGAGPAGHR